MSIGARFLGESRVQFLMLSIREVFLFSTSFTQGSPNFLKGLLQYCQPSLDINTDRFLIPTTCGGKFVNGQMIYLATLREGMPWIPVRNTLYQYLLFTYGELTDRSKVSGHRISCIIIY